jgi:hypothetical protein
MQKEKKRSMRFYAEMIIVTVLSLVAASLWIEYVKGFVSRCFDNHPTAMLASAMVVTFMAIVVLNILFTHLLPDQKGDHTPESQIAA